MLGFNTNPTAEQLVGVTRQLINFDELKASETANYQDELSILTTNSSASINRLNIQMPICSDDESESEFNYHLNFKDM